MKNDLKREYIDISKRILNANELDKKLKSEERIKLEKMRYNIKNKLGTSDLLNVDKEIQEYLNTLQVAKGQGFGRNMRQKNAAKSSETKKNYLNVSKKLLNDFYL